MKHKLLQHALGTPATSIYRTYQVNFKNETYHAAAIALCHQLNTANIAATVCWQLAQLLNACMLNPKQSSARGIGTGSRAKAHVLQHGLHCSGPSYCSIYVVLATPALVAASLSRDRSMMQYLPHGLRDIHTTICTTGSLTLQGRLLRAFWSSCCSCQSNTSKFEAIRAALADLGRQLVPRCSAQRINTCNTEASRPQQLCAGEF